MATGIELRPIFYGHQLMDVLAEIIGLLKVYRPYSESELLSKSLCYHRDGSIEICDKPCVNSLLDWPLSMVLNKDIEFIDSIGVSISTLKFNYDNILKFAGLLVSESEYDNELTDKYYFSKHYYQFFKPHPNNITDFNVGKRKETDKWIDDYKSIKFLVSNVCLDIKNSRNWTNLYEGILKDRILSEIFHLNDYLPKRENRNKEECLNFFYDLQNRGGYEALSEYNQKVFLEIKDNIIGLVKEPDLFTESILDDLALYAVALDEIYRFWNY